MSDSKGRNRRSPMAVGLRILIPWGGTAYRVYYQ